MPKAIRWGLRAGAGLWVDVGRFHELLAQVAGHSHPPHRLCDACLAALTEAASLYTADFLAGFTLDDAAEFDAWQTFQTESAAVGAGRRAGEAGYGVGWPPGIRRGHQPCPALVWRSIRCMSQRSAC